MLLVAVVHDYPAVSRKQFREFEYEFAVPESRVPPPDEFELRNYRTTSTTSYILLSGLEFEDLHSGRQYPVLNRLKYRY